MNCPKQGTFVDCGVFTILKMTLLMKGQELTANSYSQTKIYEWNTRKRIGQIIHQSHQL